jgi:hypothetical protein
MDTWIFNHLHDNIFTIGLILYALKGIAILLPNVPDNKLRTLILTVLIPIGSALKNFGSGKQDDLKAIPEETK